VTVSGVRIFFVATTTAATTEVSTRPAINNLKI
ncbi:MAG: hypothetical protein ACI90V_011514, partial [Bacillariaceae sp.]